MKKYVVIIFLFLFYSYQTFADTHEVTSCTVANVQAAINAATAGDTVYLNCASATWSSGVNINKGITVTGRGASSTTITGNSTTAFFIGGTCSHHQTGATRLTSMGLEGGDWTGLVQAEGTFDSLRIDNIKFRNINTMAIQTGWETSWDDYYTGCSSGQFKALIDHIDFATDSKIFIKSWGRGTPNWIEDDGYGTDYSIFVEDSTFSWTGGGTFSDSENGARFVFRYNNITNGNQHTHDLGSTQECRGHRLTEIYNNTFSCNIHPFCDDWTAMVSRGGTGVYYNNTVTGHYQAIGTQIWRVTASGSYIADGDTCAQTGTDKVCSSMTEHCSGAPHNICYRDSDCSSGTCVSACTSDSDCRTGDKCVYLDGQNTYGWPCRDQTGRGKEDATTHVQSSSPVYFWRNGTSAGCATGGTCTGTFSLTYFDPHYIAEGRDVCNHSPATSPNPVNAGTCNGTTLNYTPYIYPHPLQEVGSSPATPSGIEVIYD